MNKYAYTMSEEIIFFAAVNSRSRKDKMHVG